MGEALASVVSETPDFQNIDYVVPVPIHFTRRLTRGYNQSDLLAKELSKRMVDTDSLDALVRLKRTVKLKKLDKEARKNALHNAIILNKHMAEAIKDKNLLLVDDIYTTGTTLEACAKVLYESGCASVYAVTLAMGY
jgi:ComF family protein